MKVIGRFFHKPYRWAALYSLILSAATAFVLLDTFVIPKTLAQIPAAFLEHSAEPPAAEDAVTASQPGLLPPASEQGFSEPAAEPPNPEPRLMPVGVSPTPINAPEEAAEDPEPENNAPRVAEVSAESAGPLIGAHFYTDENITIQIETLRKHDTTLYIADIVVRSAEYLKTALAKNLYGRNIRDTTSAIAAAHDAIFAVNGDYYGFRNAGCVLRNGVLYRNTGDGEALVMDRQGNFRFLNESEVSSGDMESAWQIWSFGPALVREGKIAVGSGSEISGRSAPSNPRTAIGQAGPLHYIMIVSDGRTSRDRGLSLLELAEEFAARGCTAAYNLDGGGSSSMVFNGRVINNPTTDGRRIDEREVSDIVYIGYR